MRTPLCDRLGIDLPIIQAGMGGAACPALAAAVSNAGGLGMLALSWTDAAAMRQQIKDTRALTKRPFGVNLILEWPQEDRVAVCLEERVPILSFFWGDPSGLIECAHAAGAIVLHTVSSAEEARHAVAVGADAVVAQGWEAGGHVRGNVATLPLVPTVVDAVSPTPVIAAGGIADGRGLAAALALGASGAWIGTRFLASEEAEIHPRYRDLLVEAGATDTVHTELFDVFHVEWPNAPHRVLRNETYRMWEAAGRPPTGERPGEGEVLATSVSRGNIVRYQCVTPRRDFSGDIDALSLWAGQGVELVSRVQPAAEIVFEIAKEADAALRRLTTQLG